MKSNLIIGLSLILASLMPDLVYAQEKGEHHKGRQQRQEWNREMLQAKIDYISRELKLTDEQREKFAPAFESMDKEIGKLNCQTRSMAKTIYEKGDKATDLELEKASEAMFELRGKESEVEMKYYRQFKQILSPRQMFKFKEAERKFNKELMRQHRKVAKK